MGASSATQPELAPKLTAVVLFLSAAVSVASVFWTLFGMPRWDYPAYAATAACPFVFLSGCILILSRPRLGYLLGLIAGLMAIPWIVETELGVGNSWIVLNYTDPRPFEQ